jgi:RNA polymerase sigma-70 factor (ECF subfamily)
MADAELDVERLSAELRDGSWTALERAYREWSPLIQAIAHRSLGHGADAEDVTQQVFLSAWRGRQTLRPSPTALPAWLVGIARHRIADVHAGRSRELRLVDASSTVREHDGPPEDERAVLRLVVAHALTKMPVPRGEVLRLVLVEQRTQEEAAALLGLPLGTVKSHVRRGLLQLRAEVEEVSSDASR